MRLNPEIKGILKEFNIDPDEGFLILLGVYYGLDVDKVCSEEQIKAINLTKIVHKVYSSNSKSRIDWLIPLFVDQPIGWDWVINDYNSQWNWAKDRKDGSTDVITRMQEWFKIYPQYRKDDVIRATQNYHKSVSSPQYVKRSAKFIREGQGAVKESMLLAWCERLEPDNTILDMRGAIIT